MLLLNILVQLHHTLEIDVLLALPEVVLAILLLVGFFVNAGSNEELAGIDNMLRKIKLRFVLLYVILDLLHLLRLQEVRFGVLEFETVGKLLENSMVEKHLPYSENVEEFDHLVSG